MHISVFVTAKDLDEAQKISRSLVEQKLVACANIVPGVQSLFWWEGKIDEAGEVLLILKTRRSLFKEVEKAVRRLHSYSCPEVIALPIVNGSKDYLGWIADSTKTAGKK